MFTKNSATRGCSRSEVYLSRSSVYRILETRGKLLITNIAVQVLIPDRNNCFCLELESAFGGCVKANSKMSTTVRESTNEGDCKNEPGKQKKESCPQVGDIVVTESSNLPLDMIARLLFVHAYSCWTQPIS